MTVRVALEGSLSSAAGADRWLYAGQDPAWRLAAEAGPFRGVPRVDVADALQARAEELRRPFLEWIGELAAENDSPVWWASQLAARTSFTRFFDRVAMLGVVLDRLSEPETGTTLVVCSSPALAGEVARAAGATAPPAPEPVRSGHPGDRLLRAWTRVAPRPVIGLPGRLSTSLRGRQDYDPRYRKSVLARHGLLTRRRFGGPRTAVLFTWIDERSFAPDGSYRDAHLGPLAELLRARGLDVAFVARVLPRLRFAEAVERLQATGETFLYPDAYLELDDYRRCAREAAAFAPAIPGDASVAGVPVAALARELVDAERSVQAAALVLDPLLRRFAEAGVLPERIVHTCEGHPWELVLGASARRHLPETIVVGYENLNMSRLALSMFPAQAELDIRPLPDWIVTNGPAFRDALVADGVPEPYVRAGCGLRHDDLWARPERTGRPGRPLRVLAATEITLGPSVELVAKAAEALGGSDEVELSVKCHPLVARSEIERVLGRRAAGVRFVEAPTLELLATSDVLLYTYTGVAFEALALGVPPLLVRSESSLDLDQLEFAADLRWQARTPDEMRAAVREIAALDERTLDAWRARARAAALRVLAPVTPECVEAFL